MDGRILKIVAELIVDGLRSTEAASLVERSDLSWLREPGESVPLEPYRELLAEVMGRHGGAPILQAGTGLRDVAHPLLFVLLNSDHPEELIRKEHRLGRYIHSRHRVQIVVSATNTLVLEHLSDGPEPAQPTENLASCGQHIALLEMIGARGLKLRFPRSSTPEREVYREGELREVSGSAGFELWDFRWQEFLPRREPMAGLDAVLLQQARPQQIEERPAIAAAVEGVVAADLERTWSVDRVAGELGLSSRTLQRRLSDIGRTFSELVLDIRAERAARLLRETDLSVTAIGYLCGFADASHFNRTFRSRYDDSPGAWRRQN